MKKKKGNITITFALLLVSLFALCTFSVDAGILILTRYKLQKAVETTSLAVASKPAGVVALDDVNHIFMLFTEGDKNLQNAQITDFQTSGKKIKLQVTVNSPTYFLGLLGVHTVRLNARAYALSEEKMYTSAMVDFKPDEIITNKDGDDFKIKFTQEGNYAVFGGIETQDGTRWQNLSCKINKVFDNALGENLEYFKAEISEEIIFDFSKDCASIHEAGIVNRLKIVSLAGFEPNVEIIILNNVKLISSADYLL